MIEIDGKKYYSKTYFDKDYFETSGYKSGYNKNTLNRESYLNKAIAVWIAQSLKLGGSERVLEIGCAFGWVVEHLISMYGFDAYGQDISAYSTTNAPQEIKDRIRECKNTEIAFDGKFDLVYSLETFEHIPKPLVDEYFKNIYDCLNDKGLLFCSICLGHNDERGADIDQSHQTLQPREWWNAKLEKAGFTIRKDLEAEAYELGLQTAEMPKGEWLPRVYNWHVFVAEKPSIKTDIATNKIYDRQLLVSQEKGKKPRLLVVGNREGSFHFPTTDFFQIDNWGNYLSYFFDGEYHSVANDRYEKITWGDYDLMLTSLDHDTVSEISKSDWKKCPRRMCFLAGTLSMMGENKEHRIKLIEMLHNFDVAFAHAPHVKTFLKTFGVESTECSEIFPFRFFDHHFKKLPHEGTTVFCAGFFDSHTSLCSHSLYLASQYGDKVFMPVQSTQNIEELTRIIPENAELFYAMPQNELYAKILSQVDIVLKMDNPAGVGRIIAEAAAGQIPTIAGGDLFQIRCYPELMVSGLDALEEIIHRIEEIKNDPERAHDLGILARERLKASNYQHFQIMLRKLQEIGFDAETPKGVYW